jgi:hypothetical protein
MVLATTAAVAGGGAALAQQGAHGDSSQACASGVLALNGLAGWEQEHTPLAATPGAYDLAVTQLVVGHAVDATLEPVSQVKFVVAPERESEPETYAGMFEFEAPVAGIYKVVVSAGAWIDVVEGAKLDALAKSTAFGHGPGCGGIGKAVEFELQPGRHVLELSRSPQADISVLIGFKS